MNTAKLTRENCDRTLWYWEDDIYFFVARVNEGNDKPTFEYGTVRYDAKVGNYLEDEPRGQNWPTFEEALGQLQILKESMDAAI